jgi:hypothetical protein
MNNQTQEALKMAIEEIQDLMQHIKDRQPDMLFTGSEYVINACKEALEQPTQDDYKIGYEHGKQHFLEKYYKGNSIQHWHNKAVAYGNTISELWTVLKSKGFGADGKTSIIDMLGKALEQPAQTYQHKWDRCGERCLKCGDKDWMGGACSVADEQPAQEPVGWMKSAIDNARDVCKYLDHDMVKEAKAHTKFFWGDIDKIKEAEDALSNSDTI